MIRELINILNNKKELSGWKIIHTKSEGKEAYFIKNILDMCRGKDIETCTVTIFRDFSENGTDYRGSCNFSIHPTMTKEEMEKAIDDAFYASLFVRNRHFPLVEPENFQPSQVLSNLKSQHFEQLIGSIAGAVLKADLANENINSFEIFLTKEEIRLITSKGIDYKGTRYVGEMECVTNYNGEKEEIELYDLFRFASFNEQELTNRIMEQIKISHDRAMARKTPNLGSFNVIVKDDSVRKILEFFANQTDVNSVYQQVSQAKLNQYFQKQDAAGDRITLIKVPFLPNSTNSLPFDDDGIILKPVTVIDKGRIVSYHGSSKIAHYLNLKPVGVIGNNRISPGRYSEKELKREPYLEVVSFSDLQVDPMVGSVGGEIRLAYYFDGDSVTPVYGGSVSGNIMDVLNDLYLSKETISIDDYEGPKFLKLKMMVTGNN